MRASRAVLSDREKCLLATACVVRGRGIGTDNFNEAARLVWLGLACVVDCDEGAIGLSGTDRGQRTAVRLGWVRIPSKAEQDDNPYLGDTAYGPEYKDFRI